MQIQVEVPEQLGLLMSKDELGQEIKLSYALSLFKAAKISIGLAKDLAGVNIYDFMQICAQHQIPVVNYSVEDLEEEIQNIQHNRI